MAGKKILVADDSLTIQKVIRLALSNEGYEIQAVSDGNDAVQQISVFRPDIVLIDVSLPGQSAFQVKRTVNGQPDLRQVRFILMSSAFEKVDEDQASEVAFQGRLTKPFDPAHLRQVLSDVLTQEVQRPASSPDFRDHEPSYMPPTTQTGPEGAPPLPPTGSPVTGDLWDSEPSFAVAPPASFGVSDETGPHMPPPLPFSSSKPSAPPAPKAPATASDDQDIKHLTESTIRMSGLDDYEWSIQEPSMKGESQFQVQPPPVPPARESSRTITPPPGPIEPDTSRVGEVTHGYEEFNSSFPPNAAYFNAPESETTRPSIDAFSVPSSEEPSVMPVSADHMEALVKKQVEEVLQKMAQKLLPEVAERIIKQEIHKLLSENGER